MDLCFGWSFQTLQLCPTLAGLIATKSDAMWLSARRGYPLWDNGETLMPRIDHTGEAGCKCGSEGRAWPFWPCWMAFDGLACATRHAMARGRCELGCDIICKL